jgi:hypothetical protein
VIILAFKSVASRAGAARERTGRASLAMRRKLRTDLEKRMRAKRGVLFTAGCVALLCAACSSSKPVPASQASSSAAQPPAGGAASITVTGALNVTAQQVANPNGCATEDAAAGGTRSFVDLNYTAPGGGKYRLQVTFFKDGATTRLPLGANDPFAGARLSLWQTVPNDYLTWGYDSASAGSTATGTVTISADAKTGSLDVSLLFAGDTNNQIPAASKPPVAVKGSWHCG